MLDYLEESGQLDNTIVVVVSDNGASGEGGPNGSFNEWRFFNGVADTTETTLPHIDELGTPQSYNHYCTGWAWAFDTPFPYWKRWAGYEGGVADMCLVAWPKQIKASNEVRHQYIHAVDVVPTVYDLLGIEPPAVIKGYTQSPIEGESFAAALTDPTAPGKQTQFYAMLGQRSIYHDGWLACTVHPPISGWGKFELDEWELYDLEHDRSQSKNVADDRARTARDAEEPLVLLRRDLQRPAARRPHRTRADARRTSARRHRTVSSTPTTRDVADVPEAAGVAINGRSYTIAAGVEIDSADAEGVLFAHGGVAGGHSLYVKDKKLRYTFNWLGTKLLRHRRRHARSRPGTHVFTAEFASKGQSTDPTMPGFAGTLTLYVDTTEGRRGRDRHPTRQLLPRRRRHLRRARQRITGDARIHRAVPRSPAAPSTRSSSTSPASITSTTRPRCGLVRASTDVERCTSLGDRGDGTRGVSHRRGARGQWQYRVRARPAP